MLKCKQNVGQLGKCYSERLGAKHRAAISNALGRMRCICGGAALPSSHFEHTNGGCATSVVSVRSRGAFSFDPGTVRNLCIEQPFRASLWLPGKAPVEPWLKDSHGRMCNICDFGLRLTAGGP